MASLTFRSRPAAGETGVAETLRTRFDVGEVFIRGEWFGDDDAGELGEALAGNISLKRIYLVGCSFGARGLSNIAEALKVNDTLENLFLDSTDIGDAGAAMLADALVSNSTLYELFLQQCGFGVLGSKAIAKALETNASLGWLDMGHNKIGDAGALIIADALASSGSWPRIQIQLAGCSIGEQGAMALARAWGTNLALTVCTTVPPVVTGVHGVHEEARRIRGLVLELRDKLVAFCMASVPRLGGTRSANAEFTRSPSSKECIFHFMNKDVFRLVGEACGDY